MERINSIDCIRGICIWIMIYGHLLDWWIYPGDLWFKKWLFAFLEPIGATGFVFISGISTTLAFKSNLSKNNLLNKTDFAKYAYFLRACLILVIAFLMNIFSLVMLNGTIFDIWSWLVLQTIGFSLILSWPLLNNSKILRIWLGIFLIIGNQLLLSVFFPFMGQGNIMGVIFHILYNPPTQYVILTYFGIFIIGTSVGEYIFNFNIIDNLQERRNRFSNDFFNKSLIYGCIFVGFGLFFAFPNFLVFNTISSIIYSLGLISILLSFLIFKELNSEKKYKKNYRYFFFYSYYSFTIYLGHYVLFYLFLNQINWIMFLILVLGVLNIIFTFFIRAVYLKFGSYASIKTGISVLSADFALKLIKKRKMEPNLTEML